MFFCTLFDSNFIDRALILYDSLCHVMTDFKLFMFTLDDTAFNILNDLCLVNAVIIRESDFEDDELKEVKKTRTRTEYCWTCTPSVIRYAIIHFELKYCIYIDADMKFYSSPEILLKEVIEEKGDICIIGHRFAENFMKKTKEKQHGKYCVEFNLFSNNVNGMKILEWWREKCLESCSMKEHDDSFGDQMYLNNWPLIFDNVYEVQNKGAGVAPWNITQYKLIDRDQNQIILKYKKSEICKLVFFHFQGLNFIDGKIINLHIYNEMGPIDDELVNLLYDEYIREILDARVFLQKQYMHTIQNPESRTQGNKWHYTGVQDLITYVVNYTISRIRGKKNWREIK